VVVPQSLGSSLGISVSYQSLPGLAMDLSHAAAGSAKGGALFVGSVDREG